MADRLAWVVACSPPSPPIAALGVALLFACASPDAPDRGSSSGASTSGSSTLEPTSESSDSTTSIDSSSGAETSTVDPPRVLFIGNSYTFVNDLPGMFESMTAADDAPHVVSSLATAGATVADHVVDPQLASVLAEGWDVVVVQGQSVEPIIAYDAFEQGVLDLATSIDDASPGAELVLFETWARADGSPDLAVIGMSAEEMQQALTDGYANAALAVGAIVVPVGRSWANAATDAPEIELYADDGSHPSVAGSFLATCGFFGTLTGSPATGSAWVPAGLVLADADRLEAVADATIGG